MSLPTYPISERHVTGNTQFFGGPYSNIYLCICLFFLSTLLSNVYHTVHSTYQFVYLG